MGSLPHILSPLPAAVAAAIAVPTLLLLYFLKLRRREMPISSTFLWKRAVQDLQVNAPFQRLRKNLLLLLQMLALAALILALARPVSNYTPGAGKLSVILIDRSASMATNDMPGGRTRLDQAKREADDLIDGMTKGGQAVVIAFDDQPEIVQTFTGDTAALKLAVDRIATTDRRTDLKMAYQLAGAQASFIPQQNRANVTPDVYLFSDGRVPDAANLRLDGALKYRKIGTDAAGNVAVVSLDAKRNYEDPVLVQAFARLANYGPEPVTTEVRMTVDNADRGVATVTLPPERWSDPEWVAAHPGEKKEGLVGKPGVDFRVQMPAAGIIRVEQMHKAGDSLAADDTAAVVVPPPKTLSVLLVEADRTDPFLERAFAIQHLKDPQTMSVEQYEHDKPANFDVIIFDHVEPEYLPDAGGFLWFGCAPPKGRLHIVREGDVDQTVSDVSVLDWQRDSPILRPLPSLGNIFAGTMYKLAVPGDATILIDGVKGPMVVMDREGRSTNIVVAFELLQSNWPIRQKSFPLFIHFALEYLALGSDMSVRPSYQPGATPRVPRGLLDKLGPDVRSVTLSGPSRSRVVPIPADGDFVFPALNYCGVYKTDPPIPQFEQLAVNLLDANESDVMAVDTPPGEVGTPASAKVASVAAKGRREMWWWLVACGAVPLLMIEWLVYTRRVHL